MGAIAQMMASFGQAIPTEPYGFESGIAPYTTVGPNVSIDGTVAHSGTHSLKFSGATGAGWNNIAYKNLTFPATGTFTFERWFRYNGTNSGTVGLLEIPSVFPITEAYVDVYIDSSPGIYAYTTGYTGLLLTALAALSVNTFYRLEVIVNVTLATYTAAIYNASGTLIGSLVTCTFPVISPLISASPRPSFMGIYNTGTSFNIWFDDTTEGGL